MKIIFLDIDGVLNSIAYDRTRTDKDGNIDKTRLVLLREIVDKTEAKIVLSSSWRKHWYRDKEKCDGEGREVAEVFEEAGIEIYDKTPQIGYLERANEIRAWLEDNPDTEKFVIIDDIGFGWDELSDNLVKTDSRIGRGLENKHVQKAIKILE